MRIARSRPALVLGGVAALAAWSLTPAAVAGTNTPPAYADHGSRPGQAGTAAPSGATGQAKGATRGPRKPTGNAAHQPAAGANAHAVRPPKHQGRPAQTPAGTPAGTPGGTPAGPPAGTPAPGPAAASGQRGAGDPAGNNGTVKIDRLGDLDRIPNNVPHPGCTFQVEWYGFDGGPDVVSTVTFTAQAPTADAGITVTGPTTVSVGGDAASGAGTDTGLDAVQAYTLSFTGAPHPQQGYHVRLTVHTPRSQGNDTKTKVFWVEPCTTPVAALAPSAASWSTPADAAAAPPSISVPAADGPGGPSMSTRFSDGAPARGLDLVTGQLARSAPASAEVPTAVDAGEDGGVLTRAPASLVAFALTLGGLASAGAALALRLRRRA